MKHWKNQRRRQAACTGAWYRSEVRCRTRRSAARHHSPVRPARAASCCTLRGTPAGPHMSGSRRSGGHEAKRGGQRGVSPHAAATEQRPLGAWRSTTLRAPRAPARAPQRASLGLAAYSSTLLPCQGLGAAGHGLPRARRDSVRAAMHAAHRASLGAARAPRHRTCSQAAAGSSQSTAPCCSCSSPGGASIATNGRCDQIAGAVCCDSWPL